DTAATDIYTLSLHDALPIFWIRPVDRASGMPSGAAVRINTEVTDAPTWSGDSQQLLYLSNGKLRLIPRSGGRARDVELDLAGARSEEHTTELQSRGHLVCRL